MGRALSCRTVVCAGCSPCTRIANWIERKKYRATMNKNFTRKIPRLQSCFFFFEKEKERSETKKRRKEEEIEKEGRHQGETQRNFF